MATKYLIWSHEHDQWWRPNREGYTPRIEEAGRYTFDEVAEVVVPHIPPGEEVAVDERVAPRWGEAVAAKLEAATSVDNALDVLKTIENDDGKIPEWLWDRMQDTINDVERWADRKRWGHSQHWTRQL